MADIAPHKVLAEGLRFPEGPIARPDGSVLVVETRVGALSHVGRDGRVEEIALLNPDGYGGANGAAIGPDGAAYVCNNGGFAWTTVGGREVPVDVRTGANVPPGFTGGWIDRVDLTTGESTVLYRDCEGQRFVGPNDLVFDSSGGFWFTDYGKTQEQAWDKGGLYYAQPDGSSVKRAIWPLVTPNGVGLSPDESTLYVAETMTGRLWAFDLDGPGEIRPSNAGHGGRCLASTPGHLDSLAIDGDGNIVVGAIRDGLCVVAPDGSSVEFLTTPESMATNICFGGDDLRTAYVTLSGTGLLIAFEWPRPGLALAF